MGTASNHVISFVTANGITSPTDNMILTFQGFDLSGVVLGDIQLSDAVPTYRTLASTPGVNTWGVTISDLTKTITFLPPTSGTGYFPVLTHMFVNINTDHMVNPASVGTYEETITINSASPEQGLIAIPIVDSDQVMITGYVSAYIFFDIDTNTDNTDCAYNDCKIHGGPLAAAGSNYTVDLGELKSTYVNRSQNSVIHSDGIIGKINSIYFDLTTNSISGAVVTVKSQNGGLQGPGSNFIPSVATDGDDIPVNSGRYGYTMPTTVGLRNPDNPKFGTIVTNVNCSNSNVKFCGPSNSITKEVFNTNGNPIDTARVQMDIATGASYTNNPGVYTDTLTFIATSTF